MCGRFALMTAPREVATALDAVLDAADHGPRPDIRPTQDIDTVISEADGRVMRPVRWGFVPEWFKRLDDGPLIINARSETIAEKPAFREAVRLTRCLIPADGFYEWQALRQGKRVHWLELAEGGPFTFAGVWREWRSAEGETLTTAAIVTTAAPGDLEHIHARAPLVISPEDRALWLGEAGHGAARLMRPAAPGFWRVTPDRGPPTTGRRLL